LLSTRTSINRSHDQVIHNQYRWQSSLWKLVWKKLVIYLVIFFAISLMYRAVLLKQENPECKKEHSDVTRMEGGQNFTFNQKPEECDQGSYQRQQFETVVEWLRTGERLPLTFLLGFYVSLVVRRWWEQYNKLPWPDYVATLLQAGVFNKMEGDEDGNRQNERIRRTVVRYLILAYVLCLRRISSRLRNQFPDMDSLLASSLVRKDEVALIGDEEQGKIGRHGGSNWWLPIKWSVSILRDNFIGGRVNENAYVSIIRAISGYRKSLTDVATYGHVPVPLVYTQVVHLAVYFYFAVALIGRQSIITDATEDTYQSYIPMFLIAEFIFYFGWLKVAITLYNPFGDDDDDFELMALVNRHIRVCMDIVNEDQEGQVPTVEDDLFWQPPPDAPKDWKPTFEIRPTEDQPFESFSIGQLLSRRVPVEEEMASNSMQVECRDQGLMRRSPRQINRPTAVLQPSLSVKEEEDELDDVVQVESQNAGPEKQTNF